MVAEDTDLISALDALEVSKGPQPMTCQWWDDATPEQRDAVVRNVRTKGHTLITNTMRKLGYKVTPYGIRDHAAGKCDKCQI